MASIPHCIVSQAVPRHGHLKWGSQHYRELPGARILGVFSGGVVVGFATPTTADVFHLQFTPDSSYFSTDVRMVPNFNRRKKDGKGQSHYHFLILDYSNSLLPL
jgi:hypothetical protein